jgi:hypothetical protein
METARSPRFARDDVVYRWIREVVDGEKELPYIPMGGEEIIKQFSTGRKSSLFRQDIFSSRHHSLRV